MKNFFALLLLLPILVSCSEESAAPIDLETIAMSTEYAQYRNVVAQRGLYHIENDTDHDALMNMAQKVPAGQSLADLPATEVKKVQGGQAYVAYKTRLKAARAKLHDRFGFGDLPLAERIKVIDLYNDLKGSHFMDESFELPKTDK